MAKTTPTPSSASQILSGGLIIMYLFIGFVPNWGAVDKIAPQWLLLSCINLTASLYVLIYYNKFKLAISNLFVNSIALFYIFFFVWVATSYFYAINPTEALVNIPRHANTLFMLLYLFLFHYQFPNANAITLWLVTIILGIEVYILLSQALEMYQSTGNINSNQLKGVTANRNITAFSIVVKLPFLLLILDNIKKRSTKLFVFLLSVFSIFSITIIASRASFIAVGLVALGYILLQLYNYFYYKKNTLYKIGYILIPIVLSLLFNQFIFANKNSSANVISRAATITVDGSDNSINQRLRYYEDVLTHIKKSPFLGVGIGNWKIKSIDYDKNNIKGYIVPYHAHSDFIQLGAELGILGFLLYLGIFISAIFFVYILIMSRSLAEKEKSYVFMLLIALGVYTIDANLNFPIARPQVLSTFALILALIGINYAKSQKQNNIKIQRLGVGFPIIGILIMIPSVSVTNTTYKSLKAQMLILQDFNSNKYNLPLNQIETFIPFLPNITVTTIPMDAIKARYYFHYKKYDKALALAETAKEANPYLRYPEILQSQIYEVQGDREAAWEMAKLAFEQLPRNALHASKFINLSMQLGKRDAIRDAFPLLTLHNEFNNWKNYLVAVAQLFPPGLHPFVRQAEQAAQLFPGNQDILNLQRLITLGTERINTAAQYSQEGLNFFNAQDYANAAVAFEKAIAANPLDYAHFENAATSYYLLNDIEKGLEKIDVVITSLNPNNGKCEYIKALLLMRMQDAEGACPLFKNAVRKGYTSAQEMLKSYCNK